MQKETAPKPVASIQYINFGTVRIGSIQRATVVVQNAGGNYQKLSIESFEPWLKIAWRPLSAKKELPLRLQIKAAGEEPGRVYQGFIIIGLDEKETKIKIRFRTRKKRKAVNGKVKPETIPVTISPLLKEKKRIKKRPIAFILFALAIALVIVFHPAGEQMAPAESTNLENLDRWIEGVLIFDLTSRPEEWYDYWYDDVTVNGNDVRVSGGITFTGADFRFQSVAFIFYSPNEGQNWQVGWRSDR